MISPYFRRDSRDRKLGRKLCNMKATEGWGKSQEGQSRITTASGHQPPAAGQKKEMATGRTLGWGLSPRRLSFNRALYVNCPTNL